MSLPKTFKALIPSDSIGGKPHFTDLPLEKPGKDQVLVKIEYAALNAYDVEIMRNDNNMAKIMQTKVVGCEGSGTVVEVGTDLKTQFKVGDKVHVNGDGTFAEYLCVETDQVFPIEIDISMEEAAHHLNSPGIAYYIGELAKKGGHKTVINTAAASAAGRMLIKYFKELGIKLINVVRKEEHVEELKAMGADYVLNCTAKDFEEKLKEISEKENATMAMEAVGGELTGKVFNALPANSVCYIYGYNSNENVKELDIHEFFRGKRIEGVVLFGYFEELDKKGEWRKVIEEIHRMMKTVFRTKINKVFKLEELDEAIEFYGKHSSEGKVVLQPN